ncbi:MAG: ABC transporter ATP-binding protein [Pseudomonadales bacterium]|nr:ABC transporter ATP-binding protein [Pseudomonadales bacterium]
MNTPATPLIKLRNISRHFLTDSIETRAVSDISLTIQEGEYVSISGPSGCGKSTLLSIIGLLDSPTGGTYLLNGHEAAGLDAYQRAALRNKEIGFVFQSFNLIGDMTVFENVELPLVYGKMPKQARREVVMDKLRKVHMEHRADHHPSQLSGGQQQRVAVARGIVNNPSILLADEPTGNLDTFNGAAIMDLLDALNAEGRTICMVTHDARFARRASRKVELMDGELIGKA